jgi:branched-chain amino acid transport system permease protein
MLICAALGILIERLAYRPLRNASKLNVLITAIGVSLLLENAGQFFFGANPKAFPALFPVKNLNFANGLVFSSSQLAVVVITVILLVALQFIVRRSSASITTWSFPSPSALAPRWRRRAAFCIR